MLGVLGPPKLQALVYDILLWRKVPESVARSVGSAVVVVVVVVSVGSACCVGVWSRAGVGVGVVQGGGGGGSEGGLFGHGAR